MKKNYDNIINPYLDKYPKLSLRSLSKLIHKENPLLFNNVDTVRSNIQYRKGSAGQTHRKNKKDDKYFKTENIIKKYNLPGAIEIEYKPYQITGNKALIFADVHIPFHSIQAIETMFNFTIDKNIDTVIIDGDFADCYDISNFNKEPDLIRFNDERNAVKIFLKELKKVYPNANIYYKFGNHESVEKNTDILTIDGWKAVIDVTKDDYIAQYDILTKEMSYSKPIELVHHYSEKMIEIESWHHKQIVTLNHDVIINDKKIKAKDLLKYDIKENNLPITTNCNNPGIKLTDNEIRLLQWVIADGCMVQDKKYINKKRIQFKLSKIRKIEVLTSLLLEMEIPYTVKLCKKGNYNILQPYYIRIYGEYATKIFNMLHNEKTYPESFRLINRKQIEILLKEMSITDGAKSYKHINYTSSKENEIDLLQEIFLKNGFITTKIKLTASSGFKTGATSYRISIFYKNAYNYNVSIKEIEYNDTAYCFTMPKGTIITRHSGKIGITGNCRFENYLMHKAPEIYGCEEFRLEILFDLFNIGIKYIPADKYIILNNNLNILHGHEYKNGITSPANPARTTFLRTKASALSAHNHQTSEHTESRIDGDTISCWSIGCLCGLNPKYMPLNKFNHGFAIYTKDDEKFWHIQNKKIIKGRVV